VEVILAQKDKISKIQHLEIKQTELVGEEIGFRRYRIIGFYVDWEYNTIVGETYA
jgi:hypothetical protein